MQSFSVLVQACIPASRSSELEVDDFVSLVSVMQTPLFIWISERLWESVLCVKVILCVKTEQMGCKWF